ncbi:hypothetical protein Tco_0831840, partial [Tanacetum coccineum]
FGATRVNKFDLEDKLEMLEPVDLDVATSVEVSQTLNTHISIATHKDLGELNPSSSTRRKTSTQYSQPGSQTRGTGTGQNVRRRSVTDRAASSSGVLVVQLP